MYSNSTFVGCRCIINIKLLLKWSTLFLILTLTFCLLHTSVWLLNFQWIKWHKVPCKQQLQETGRLFIVPHFLRFNFNEGFSSVSFSPAPATSQGPCGTVRQTCPQQPLPSPQLGSSDIRELKWLESSFLFWGKVTTLAFPTLDPRSVPP